MATCSDRSRGQQREVRFGFFVFLVLFESGGWFCECGFGSVAEEGSFFFFFVSLFVRGSVAVGDEEVALTDGEGTGQMEMQNAVVQDRGGVARGGSTRTQRTKGRISSAGGSVASSGRWTAPFWFWAAHSSAAVTK